MANQFSLYTLHTERAVRQELRSIVDPVESELRGLLVTDFSQRRLLSVACAATELMGPIRLPSESEASYVEPPEHLADRSVAALLVWFAFHRPYIRTTDLARAIAITDMSGVQDFTAGDLYRTLQRATSTSSHRRIRVHTRMVRRQLGAHEASRARVL
jgi:hypothetical protein